MSEVVWDVCTKSQRRRVEGGLSQRGAARFGGCGRARLGGDVGDGDGAREPAEPVMTVRRYRWPLMGGRAPTMST
jgi:hypothetical protein